MSDTLLVIETSAFGDVLQQFEVLRPAAQRLVVESTFLVPTAPWFDDLAGLLWRAVAQSADPVSALIEVSVDQAVESVGDELLVLERSMAQRFSGVAKAGWQVGRDQAELVVEKQVARYKGWLPDTYRAAVNACAQQVQLVGLYDESIDDLRARLFSTEPVNKKGCSGRGTWWGAVYTLQASARGASIAAVNEVRTAAMLGMNEACRGR